MVQIPRLPIICAMLAAACAVNGAGWCATPSPAVPRASVAPQSRSSEDTDADEALTLAQAVTGPTVGVAPQAIQPAETSVTLFAGVGAKGPVRKPVQARSLRQFEAAFDGPAGNGELYNAVQLFFSNGGQRAWVVCLGETASGVGVTDVRSALESVGEFNILCLPGINDFAALQAAVDVCEARGAILLLDLPPACDSPALAKQWLSGHPGLQHPNVAAYVPWVKARAPVVRLSLSIPRPGISRRVPGPFRGGVYPQVPRPTGRPPGQSVDLRPVPPSGAIAGVMARTDRARGVWKAPAGTQAHIRGIAGLVLEPSPQQINAFTALSVNPLRTLPDGPPVVWGSRTLSQNPEWRYVPIRRLYLFLHQSISRGTQWAVFEPNDEPLWQRLRLNVGDFMQGLYRKGAFQGVSPDDAYFVKCGPETTTPADIAAGVCNILVGFAAVKPAEFIILRISQQTAAGAWHRGASSHAGLPGAA